MYTSSDKSKDQIVVNDDECMICSYGISVMQSDVRFGDTKFIKRTSKEGLAILSELPDLPDTLVCLNNQQVNIKSNAVFTLMRQKGGLWKLFLVFQYLPLSMRNRLYDFIARHRLSLSHIIFRKKSC
jgi:predicted DCC family thiol-disulfide oxidoreductase YuxK